MGEGQSGQEVSVSVVYTTAIGQAEAVCRKKLYPLLYAWFGFSDLMSPLEALVVGKKPNEYAK